MFAVTKPAEDLGEMVRRYVVRSTGNGHELDFDEHRYSVIAELGDLHQPRGVTIVPRFPLSMVGKVDKLKLRSLFR